MNNVKQIDLILRLKLIYISHSFGMKFTFKIEFAQFLHDKMGIIIF